MGVVEVDGFLEEEEVDFGGREPAENADPRVLVPKLLVV